MPKNKICLYPDCNSRANSDKPGSGNRYCIKHDHLGHKKATVCISEDCSTQASFRAQKGKGPILYCAKHKPPGYVHKEALCLVPDCLMRPKFSENGKRPALYCAQHFMPGMISVINRRCIVKGCLGEARHIIKKHKNPKLCDDHKIHMDMDKSGKLCIFRGCKTMAYFGPDDPLKKIYYCRIHKKPGFIRYKYRCLYEGCKRTTTMKNKPIKKYYCCRHKIDAEYSSSTDNESDDEPENNEKVPIIPIIQTTIIEFPKEQAFVEPAGPESYESAQLYEWIETAGGNNLGCRERLDALENVQFGLF